MAQPNIFQSLETVGETAAMNIAGINPLALVKVVIGDIAVVNFVQMIMDYIFPKFDEDNGLWTNFWQASAQLMLLVGTVAEIRMNLSWIYDNDPTGASLVPAILIINSVDLRKKLAAISAASLRLFKGMLNDYSLEDVANEVKGLIPDNVKNELHDIQPRDPNKHHKKSNNVPNSQ